jgi:hypothetical protein
VSGTVIWKVAQHDEAGLPQSADRFLGAYTRDFGHASDRDGLLDYGEPGFLFRLGFSPLTDGGFDVFKRSLC